MKQHLFSVSTLVLAMALVFSACSKEGPAGPAGPQGPAGPTGPAGAAGVAGPAGTANVIYSAWLDATPTAITIGQDNFFADTIAVPKLDANILATGMVKVYFNFGTAAAPDITALPDVIYAPINPYFGIGRIDFLALFNFATGTNQQGQKQNQIRYVLIPGGVPARNNVDWNDYAAVQAFLNLKD
jgi:hypothetical protein